MKESENCYIFWDGDDVTENERGIYFQCTECHEKNGKGKLWSAKSGYPVCDIHCEFCKKLIHDKANGIPLI